MTVDELADRLAKPIFVLRYAKADTRKNSGAETRADNARREIDDIISRYVRERGFTLNLSRSDKEFAEWLGTDYEG